jgi:hypothetical protein
LLSVGADTSITDDTNGETGSERGQTASQTGGEVLVALGEGVGFSDYIIYLLRFVVSYLIRAATGV